VNRLRLLAFCAAVTGCAGSPTSVSDDGAPALGKAAAGPTVTSTDPVEAPQAVTIDVHVFGSGFDRGSKADFQRGGVSDPKVHVNGTTYRSASELVANITIAADAPTVAYDVAVTTSRGKKGIGTELFLVTIPLEPLSAPAGFSLAYDVGPTGLIVGDLYTGCGPGFAPALWNQSRELTALPPLLGTCGGAAHGVNESGVAVGSAYVGASSSRSVRWSPGPAGYVAEQLPALPDGTDPGLWSINSSGWISSGNAPAVWIPGAGWQLLAKPTGATSCFATILSNTGQATARCSIAGVVKGVTWATPAAVPSVLPLPVGATGAYPRGINSAGVIVGFATGAPGRAIRWTPSSASWAVETLVDFGRGASALGMNEAGYIVGAAGWKTNVSIPVYWDPAGGLHPLDSANRPGEALGVSEPDGGLIIGGYYMDRSGKTAVRWRP
jgi:uncharacterized membrane protein